MKTQEILRAWLKENNYDGLVHPELECGCLLNDFIPCSELGEDCEAGINRPDLRPEGCDVLVNGVGTTCWMVTKEFSDENPPEGESK